MGARFRVSLAVGLLISAKVRISLYIDTVVYS